MLSESAEMQSGSGIFQFSRMKNKAAPHVSPSNIQVNKTLLLGILFLESIQ